MTTPLCIKRGWLFDILVLFIVAADTYG